MKKDGLLSEAKANFSWANIVSIFKEEFAEGDRSKSAFRRTLSLLWRIVKLSKNPWYYWYTGSKLVAVQAWVVSFFTMFSVAALASGGGFLITIIYILLGVALESIALVVIVVALIADYYLPIPDQIYSMLLIPVFWAAFFAFIINRLSVFVVLHSKSRN